MAAGKGFSESLDIAQFVIAAASELPSGAVWAMLPYRSENPGHRLEQ
jgi:hypothetical protein